MNYRGRSSLVNNVIHFSKWQTISVEIHQQRENTRSFSHRLYTQMWIKYFRWFWFLFFPELLSVFRLKERRKKKRCEIRWVLFILSNSVNINVSTPCPTVVLLSSLENREWNEKSVFFVGFYSSSSYSKLIFHQNFEYFTMTETEKYFEISENEMRMWTKENLHNIGALSKTNTEKFLCFVILCNFHSHIPHLHWRFELSIDRVTLTDKNASFTHSC